jgi:hypothetical protein
MKYIFSQKNSQNCVYAHAPAPAISEIVVLLPHFYAPLRQSSGECRSTDEDESVFDEIGLFLQISNYNAFIPDDVSFFFPSKKPVQMY